MLRAFDTFRLMERSTLPIELRLRLLIDPASRDVTEDSGRRGGLIMEGPGAGVGSEAA